MARETLREVSPPAKSAGAYALPEITVPVGCRQIVIEVDRAPSERSGQARVVVTSEISDDCGKTWRPWCSAASRVVPTALLLPRLPRPIPAGALIRTAVQWTDCAARPAPITRAAMTARQIAVVEAARGDRD